MAEKAYKPYLLINPITLKFQEYETAEAALERANFADGDVIAKRLEVRVSENG